MSTLVLNRLTEYQRSLLTRLSYLNIDFDQFQQLKQSKGKITISDLQSIILRPNEPYLGNLRVPHLKRVLSGVEITNSELFEELKSADLGDLELLDLAYNSKSGFNGICFIDSMQNVGFSFRGTDFKTLASLTTDGFADIEAFLTNHNEQVDQALSLFSKHQSSSGQNFLFGHSLGGFIAESVYCQNKGNITNTFVINPLHIDSHSLDNKSKIAAFNDPIKFTCFITGGDYVSSINNPTLFTNNIHYVANNDRYLNNPIANHLIECAQFDEYGAFVECSKEEAFAGHESTELEAAIKFIKQEPVRGFFSKSFLTLKNYFSAIKLYLKNLFKKEEPEKVSSKHDSRAEKNTGFKQRMNPENYPDGHNSEKGAMDSLNAVEHQGPPTNSHSDKDNIK